MHKESNHQENTVNKNNLKLAFKVGLTGIVILAGTWVVLKISREILKELEGMGL